ncbi:MAG: NADH-quinone oxidoreductase subunit N, partial [Vicinamibacteria bacterium]
MGALAPFLILVATAAVIAVGGAGRGSGTRAASAGIAWLGVFACTLACLRIWGHRMRALEWLDADAFSLFLSLVVLMVLLLTIPVAKESLARQRPEGPGFYVLLLLSAAGMLLLVSSRHLAVMFVGLEAMSVGVYALAGSRRDRPPSIEASLKYFFYGATASAFFLYGIALFHVVAGRADLARIESALMAISTRGDDLGLLPLAALGLLLVGLVYTVAAVPFHMWAPDVYEGAPVMVSAFMAVAVKAAALGALLRITGTLLSLTDEWTAVLSILAVLAMTVGNLLAIVQDDFKRLLAYSGVAHAGYLLVGVVAGGVAGRSAVLFYLLGYSFMTLGAFAVAVALGKRGEANSSVREWGGLGWKYPLPGVAMSLFMLSLAGIPMTVGFVGKFYVLSAAISEGHVALVLVAVMNAVVGAYYSLRVIMV